MTFGVDCLASECSELASGANVRPGVHDWLRGHDSSLFVGDEERAQCGRAGCRGYR